MLATRSPRPGSIGLESPVSELALDDVKHNMGKRYKVTTSQYVRQDGVVVVIDMLWNGE